MLKPNRGKTETINDAIYIYSPSLGMIENWKRRAEKTCASISKFVVEWVEDSIRREEGEEGHLKALENRYVESKRLRLAEVHFNGNAKG